jgi:hypothetical protein
MPGGSGEPGPRPSLPPPPAFQPSKYVFRLDSFEINNTRSLHEDTDHVTIGLKVGDKVFDPQTRHMGDLNNGTYEVGLEFGPILIDSPNTPVAFNFQIVNNGHADNADIEQKLSAGALSLLTKVFSLTTPWSVIVGAVWDYIFGFIFADCDGPVAVDQVNLTGEALWEWTHGVGIHSQGKHYAGQESPRGCGENSSYWVTWSVVGAGVVPTKIVHAEFVPT